MIKIDNISFSYGKDAVLKNISMTLEDGKIYGLLGENGVGKTTLLTLLCGLKRPQGGEILVDTAPAAVQGSEGCMASAAYPSAIPVKPYDRRPELLEDQYFLSDEVAEVALTASDYARSYGKFWKNFDFVRFLELMDLFETDVHKKMNRMSFGQLKKTYISFALACGTRYLYMDEPTNGLDIPSKAQFRKAVMKYTREDAIILISTHQVRDLENIIDPIIILDRQDVLLNASVAEIADKLTFDYGSEKHPEALYSEMIPGGYIQVYPNADGRESKVNVEALFNTVHLHKDLIHGLFR